MAWNKDKLEQLRLRLGWSRSDLARRLNITTDQLTHLEFGQRDQFTHDVANELDLILKQAEAISDEVKSSCEIENTLEESLLSQIEFSRVKSDLE